MRIALIPSYEPDDALLEVANKLLENDFTVVVVNDGSDLKYDEYFHQLPEEVHYLRYEKNMGKGHALKHGLNYIKDHFDESVTIVTMDSDGQHKVEDAIRVIEEPFWQFYGKNYFLNIHSSQDLRYANWFKSF